MAERQVLAQVGKGRLPVRLSNNLTRGKTTPTTIPNQPMDIMVGVFQPGVRLLDNLGEKRAIPTGARAWRTAIVAENTHDGASKPAKNQHFVVFLIKRSK